MAWMYLIQAISLASQSFAGSLPLLTAVHPVLSLQNVNHDLFQILVCINELNIATLRPTASR